MLQFLRYYSRKDIQKALVDQCKGKELGVRYKEAFGKRPDTLLFDTDVFEFARKGASSFHISEETWADPLSISTGMNKKQLDELRSGWDLILDIDCPYWDYSKLTAYLLVEAFKFHNIKNISIKFSGNKGFHLGIPFEAFPDEVNGKKTKDLYPDSLRVMAEYLQEMIRPMLLQKILDKETIKDIVARTEKPEDELLKNGEFDPFTVIDIDTILISSRHLYRAAYSLHEKSGLASIPVDPNKVMEFKKEMAMPDKVKIDIPFIDRTKIQETEARELIIQAFDWHSKQSIRKQDKEDREQKNTDTKTPSNYEAITVAINEDKFPACIKKILEGNMEDGKKRALFVLLRFLGNVGWNINATEQKLRTWNNTHPDPLPESYIVTQVLWHKRQKKLVLPPNCTNENYYKEMGICCNSPVCLKYKNPVNYAKSQHRFQKTKSNIKKKVKSRNEAKNPEAPQKTE